VWVVGRERIRTQQRLGAASPKLTRGVTLTGKGKETDRAVSQLRSEFCARLTKEFAGNRSRREDCLRYVAKVRGVLDERLATVPRSDRDLRD
jgi:hypothetical protein